MIPASRRRSAFSGAALVALGLALLASAASGASLDPEADAVLKEMSDDLSGLKALSVDIEIDNEVVDLAGQKLQLSSSGNVIDEVH